MVEGELLQMQKLGHLINEEEYFDLIFRKTAYLFKVFHATRRRHHTHGGR